MIMSPYIFLKLYDLSYIHLYSSPSTGIYYELTKWPAPRWLDSSVGRALHWDHAFVSRSWLNFFLDLFYNCVYITAMIMSSCHICKRKIMAHSFINDSWLFHVGELWKKSGVEAMSDWVGKHYSCVSHRRRGGGRVENLIRLSGLCVLKCPESG